MDRRTIAGGLMWAALICWASVAAHADPVPFTVDFVFANNSAVPAVSPEELPLVISEADGSTRTMWTEPSLGPFTDGVAYTDHFNSPNVGVPDNTLFFTFTVPEEQEIHDFVVTTRFQPANALATGHLYLNGVSLASVQGGMNSILELEGETPLVGPGEHTVAFGAQTSVSGFFYFDYLRMSGTLAVIPEPATAGLFAPLLWCALRRSRRR